MKKSIGKIIKDIIYVLILIPLIIITARISYQTIFFKDKIPDIFGYKFFVNFDKNIDSSIEYGDLVITYNKNTDKINENDFIAYRTGINTVTIQKVENIQEMYDVNSNKNLKTFVVGNTKNAVEKIEGVEVKKIPQLGLVMYQIAQPKTIVIGSWTILTIGNVCIHIAKVLDEKESMNPEQEEVEIRSKYRIAKEKMKKLKSGLEKLRKFI